MTPERFRDRLEKIGWTYRGLADRLAVHETRVRRWASGMIPIPPNLGAWLERIHYYHMTHPLPEKWEDSKKVAEHIERVRGDG